MAALRLSADLLGGPCRIAAGVITRLIGPTRYAEAGEANPSASSAWVVLLFLDVSVSLLLIAAGHGAGRRGQDQASVLFWSGVVLLLVPTIGRIALPTVSRGERLCLLLLLTEALFLYKLLYSPTGFAQFDEFLHWVTADDILYRHRLFLRNPLLPVSASYPGLEILTTAFANLAHVEVFPAAIPVMAVLRGTFIAALFLFFEKVARSGRAAALACLVYMGTSNFVVFDVMFAYESLGIVFCILVLLAEADESGRERANPVPGLALIAVFGAALAVTHHVSAFACVLYLWGLVLLEALRRGRSAASQRRIRILAVAAGFATVLPILWVQVRGGGLSGYIGPIVEGGVADLANKLRGGSQARQLFVAADGTQQSIGYRLVGIASTLLVALGLATGFFRSLGLAAGADATAGWAGLLPVLRRQWRDSRALLLTLAAFGFPISVAFRLSPSAWEMGNRMGAFVYVAVGLVVALGIIHFWQARLGRCAVIGTGLALAVLVLGGITTGSAGRAIRGPYRVAADPESVEPMGIETARWIRRWLGEGNRFAADRVNRTLLATYGQQDIVTTISDGVDESLVFLADRLSPDILYPIRKGKIDYLLVDLRLTTAPPVLGEYFEQNDAGHGVPPLPSSLLKFDGADGVSRIYDNGWIAIFDVRRLHAGN